MRANACLSVFADPNTPACSGARATRQVVLAAARPRTYENSAFTHLVSWAESSEAWVLFEALYSASQALCPLESLAHLTDDSRRDLECTRDAFALVADACVRGFPAAFPESLRSPSAMRTLGGMAFAHEAWRRDVGYENLSAEARLDILLESPAFSFECLDTANRSTSAGVYS
ncbi:MAG: hypothetical protein IOD12_14770 [Silvanigrellales bacterium]|nr:hypothetical protein [Silvanigrellales bacterium]